MPYTVKKSKSGYKACKKKNGKCFSKKPFKTKKEAVSQIGAIESSEKGISKESFDSLINKYLVNYLFSEDAMAPTTPANPNAPAKPADQKKIQDAKKKKAMLLAKPGMVTQAQADAYELGRSEKL
jgi:hypothetical protein